MAPRSGAVGHCPARSRIFALDRSKSQRIENGDRPRSHGENIAQYSAHARGRALKRFNEAWMVVRLDFEDSDQAIADVGDARIFARPLDHVRTARRELFQVHARGFIGAVLAPHHAENSEFGKVRVAPEDFLRARIFVRG
jgi:hypothetical protein